MTSFPINWLCMFSFWSLRRFCFFICSWHSYIIIVLLWFGFCCMHERCPIPFLPNAVLHIFTNKSSKILVNSGKDNLDRLLPTINEEHSQKAWDSKYIAVIKSNLMLHALDNRDKARLLAAQAPHSGNWLFATPITAHETIRLAVWYSTWHATMWATHMSVWSTCRRSRSTWLVLSTTCRSSHQTQSAERHYNYGAACVELKSLHRKSRLA